MDPGILIHGHMALQVIVCSPGVLIQTGQPRNVHFVFPAFFKTIVGNWQKHRIGRTSFYHKRPRCPNFCSTVLPFHHRGNCPFGLDLGLFWLLQQVISKKTPNRPDFIFQKRLRCSVICLTILPCLCCDFCFPFGPDLGLFPVDATIDIKKH